MSEQPPLIHEFVDDLLGAADENRTVRPGALFVDVTGDFAREVSARRVFAEIGAIIRVELIEGSLRVLRHMDMRRYSDLQRACVVSSFSMTLPIGGNLA